MGYKQHNSPFNAGEVYASGGVGTNAKPNVTNLSQGLVMPDNVTAEGTDSTTDITNENSNASILNAPDHTTALAQSVRENASMGTRTGRLQKKIDDPNSTPNERGRARQKLMKTKARHERQEKRWELKNKLTEEKLAKSNPEALERIEDNATNRRFRAKRRDKIDPQLQKLKPRGIDNSLSSKPRGAVVGEFGSAQLPDFEVVSGEEKSNSGLIGALQNAAKYQMNQGPNMKQINKKGTGFPMVDPDAVDPTAMPVNRAGGGDNNVLTQGNDPVKPQFKSAQNAAAANMMSNIASDVGTPLPTNDNSNDQIAEAQNALGTDGATNTPPNTMGGSLGMYGPSFMGINPDHEGYCTPMTKETCTPRRKALAKRLKPGGDLYKGNK